MYIPSKNIRVKNSCEHIKFTIQLHKVLLHQVSLVLGTPALLNFCKHDYKIYLMTDLK